MWDGRGVQHILTVERKAYTVLDWKSDNFKCIFTKYQGLLSNGCIWFLDTFYWRIILQTLIKIRDL